MITNFVKVSLKEPNKGNKSNQKEVQTRNSLLLSYPCSSRHDCTPYVLDVAKGVYKFECWGSKGGTWSEYSQPGLGAYTSGTIFVPKPTTFYVYIGTSGYFNAVKSKTSLPNGVSPGGATDVRTETSDDWWDNYSLISRIMVAAGGGGAEWDMSIGGNGGSLTGGISTSAASSHGTEVQDKKCSGGTQTQGSKCPSYTSGPNTFSAVPGSFGYSEIPDYVIYNEEEDYGGFGGGGYYGGTSYQFAYAGSGGSSFVSGYKECDAVKYVSESIQHTGDSVHYSGFVFYKPEMIPGNETMPLPSGFNINGTHSGTGAFRITLIQYHFHCTYKKSLYFSLFQKLSFVIFFS